MRAAVRRAVVLAAAVALTMLIVPAGLGATAAIRAQAGQEVERAALAAAFRVGSGSLAGDPVELPVDLTAAVALYRRDGTRLEGRGPARAETTVMSSLQGRIVRTEVRGATVAAVPVVANEQVLAVVRAEGDTGEIGRATAVVWGSLLALGGLILAGTLLYARRTARRIASPLEQLQTRTASLGSALRRQPASSSGIEEIDALAVALTDADLRVHEQLARERELASTTSHQLRTPLAGLRVRLENGRASAIEPAVIDAALSDIDRLDRIVTGLVGLTRRASDSQVQAVLSDRLDEVEQRWGPLARQQGRSLTLTVASDAAPTPVPALAIDTVLDVLLENALRHGSGEVLLEASVIGPVLAVSVLDDGVFSPVGDGGAGIGLPLARRIVGDVGGRLVEPVAGAAARYSMLLPVPGA